MPLAAIATRLSKISTTTSLAGPFALLSNPIADQLRWVIMA